MSLVNDIALMGGEYKSLSLYDSLYKIKERQKYLHDYNDRMKSLLYEYITEKIFDNKEPELLMHPKEIFIEELRDKTSPFYLHKVIVETNNPFDFILYQDPTISFFYPRKEHEIGSRARYWCLSEAPIENFNYSINIFNHL